MQISVFKRNSHGKIIGYSNEEGELVVELLPLTDEQLHQLPEDYTDAKDREGKLILNSVVMELFALRERVKELETKMFGGETSNLG